ncbi:peptidylprolyl isomerase [Gimesia panareensis]|uniref:Foldase protein PrsA 1 n=1 Tax=Gimesia panareensis TaxID=2527978 RepID=A0A517Q0K0_9PLAN|nr:peptidylprolyl isomerase [Gimesia panareensis]QDT25145.1 Foldase protein PrsA 1 precursor [Gimesia panareensis]QDU48110.1 Foldase protein PrsA 1 precursor [Gimesia panareensis]
MSFPRRLTYPFPLCLTLCLVLTGGPVLKAADTDQVLVTVNGQPVTQADLNFARLSRGITGNQQAVNKQLLENLVDQRLIREFLAQQKITVPPKQLDESVLKVEKFIRKKGDDPHQVLTKMGFTPEKLRAAIALPLAWNIYAQREISLEKLQNYFDAHREELDGTRVAASHILLKLPANASSDEIRNAKQKLADLRQQIQSGKLSFAEAAAQYSEAPSKTDGGKLVTSAYRGKMPLVLTQHVFPLKEGEISEPFQSPFGMHLIILDKKHPGQFSLEDVRGEIYQILSSALYDQTVQKLRGTAKIEWTAETKS